jgi:hypothetical protein
VLIEINTNTPVCLRNHIVTLTCVVPASPGTVPAGALSNLLPASSVSGLSVLGSANPGTFNADLTAGGRLDFGAFGGQLGVSKTMTVR